MNEPEHVEGEGLPEPQPCSEETHPAEAHSMLGKILTGMAAVAVAGTVVLCFGSGPKIMGAPQSYRLKMEARQTVIDQAIKAEAEKTPAQETGR